MIPGHNVSTGYQQIVERYLINEKKMKLNINKINHQPQATYIITKIKYFAHGPEESCDD